MILNFIFSNLNVIVLAIWIIFWIIVAIRYFCPAWVKNISFSKLAIIAFSLRIIYGIFITWGQYYVWNSNSFTQTLLNSPLAKGVPTYDFIRPLFENNLGYFSYYVLGRFWLYIFTLFIVSILFYFLSKIWWSYRGGFSKDGPLLILILMLISGWPGVLVFIPLSLIFSIIYLVFSYFRGKKEVKIEPAFILASLVALIFNNVILDFLQKAIFFLEKVIHS